MMDPIFFVIFISGVLLILFYMVVFHICCTYSSSVVLVHCGMREKSILSSFYVPDFRTLSHNLYHKFSIGKCEQKWKCVVKLAFSLSLKVEIKILHILKENNERKTSETTFPKIFCSVSLICLPVHSSLS